MRYNIFCHIHINIIIMKRFPSFYQILIISTPDILLQHFLPHLFNFSTRNINAIDWSYHCIWLNLFTPQYPKHNCCLQFLLLLLHKKLYLHNWQAKLCSMLLMNENWKKYSVFTSSKNCQIKGVKYVFSKQFTLLRLFLFLLSTKVHIENLCHRSNQH